MVGGADWTNTRTRRHGQYNPYQIVATMPGSGTGETIIKTADGRYWERAIRPAQTGEEIAQNDGCGVLHPE